MLYKLQIGWMEDICEQHAKNSLFGLDLYFYWIICNPKFCFGLTVSAKLCLNAGS